MRNNVLRYCLLFGSLIVLVLVIVACTQKEPISVDSPEDNQETFMNLAEMEHTLVNLASVLPEALTDPELAKILYDEAKRNEEDEPYALWSKIADKPTKNGVTLRKKVHNVLKKRSLGKSANAESFTSAMDGVDYLQVYIHDFEDWKGESPLPSTFTPLTINDVDVTELTMYDTLGQTYTLEVDTIPPDYPLMVVGINESMTINEELGLTYTDSTLGKITTEPTIHITDLNLDKSAWLYEPWWKGNLNAEIYFRIYDGNRDDQNWLRFGYFIPESGTKDYKCWKWNKRLWGGYYTQDKPWRNINLDTKLTADDFLGGNFTCRVMEYDWPMRDGGIDNWCHLAGLVGAAITDWNLIVGLAFDAACELFVMNDEKIGDKEHFEDAVFWAKQYGSAYEWGNSNFKIKVEIK